MKHFSVSFFFTFICLGLGTFWGYSSGGIPGALQALFVVSILAVMEVSLSFDNAVVNASVLRTWNEFWQKLFLTVGILVAVFGMRLVFPILIVSIAICGFANFSSVGMQIGGIGELAPERRGDLARLGLKALLCGTLASYMSATIAGILM